jgi:hypothetical protein
MNLIYANNYTSARTFALHQDLMPGDWKWIGDTDVIRQNPRADVFRLPRWEQNPHHAEIDEALTHARDTHRLGTFTDLSGPGGSTLGVSGG